MRVTGLAAACVLASIIAGCASSSNPRGSTSSSFATVTRVSVAPVDPSPGGWVETEQGFVSYIEFVKDATGGLTGNLSLARTADTGITVDPHSYPLNGTISGHSIAITFNSMTWTGTVDNNAITLNITQPDGTIKQARWKRGSIDDYNAALADLRNGAISSNIAKYQSAAVEAFTNASGTGSSATCDAPAAIDVGTTFKCTGSAADGTKFDLVATIDKANHVLVNSAGGASS